MSVGLMIVSVDGSIRHDWDSNGACDRPLLRAIDTLAGDSRLSDVGGGDVWLGAEPIWRPSEIGEFRRKLHDTFDFNASYWDSLCDLLDADPDAWLYFSL